MHAEKLKTAALATTAAVAFARASHAAASAAATDLIAKIKDKDDKVRYEGIMSAGKAGASAVKPLAEQMADSDMEVARAAKRALWNLTRAAGRPGNDSEKEATVKELLSALAADRPANVKRELMWMASELAGDEAVGPMAALLKDKELREDARMVLQRLPGDKSLAALKDGLKAAPEDFKPNVALSLRQRGVETPGVPDEWKVPTRKTDLKPLTEPAEPVKKERRKGKKQ